MAFSLFATGLADVRFASDGLSLFPDDWLAEIGGAVVSAAKMRTCHSAERRLQDLSDRVARASTLLFIQVNVAVEAQNQQLLGGRRQSGSGLGDIGYQRCVVDRPKDAPIK